MMPTIKLGARDILEYNAQHGVLICRECQYAIQKSALQSHLLKHKIYRGERQRLLSSFASLEILEPHLVPLPAPASPPIDALPTISGYCCTAAGCGYLCASTKRMSRHQNEIHGANASPGSSSRLVILQTFFRGTKLRYFEVASSSTAGTAGAMLPGTTVDDDYGYHNEMCDEGRHSEQTSPPRSSLVVDPDLEMLTYFHHFTTITFVTLPSPEYLPSIENYWQTDVVLLALRRRWLMCGLLAISICHSAAFVDDTTIERDHRERSAQYFSEFSAGLEAAEAAGTDEEAEKAGRRLRWVLRFAHRAAAPSQLQSIMTLFSNPDFAFHSSYQMNAPPNAITSCGNIPSAILNRLHALPSRMAEVLGRPENSQDVLATLSAISILVKCCDTSFASGNLEAAWRGMAAWLTTVPDHFNYLVSCHSAAALVVLAHWAASLVQRAEHRGCWFLKGSSNAILLEIAEQLPTDDRAVQGLVEGLMD